MEGTARLAVKEAQKPGFIVTGWPGHTLNDDLLGIGLGMDAIRSDIPVHVQEYIEHKSKAPLIDSGECSTSLSLKTRGILPGEFKPMSS